jgi:hypothetical protein
LLLASFWRAVTKTWFLISYSSSTTYILKLLRGSVMFSEWIHHTRWKLCGLSVISGIALMLDWWVVRWFRPNLSYHSQEGLTHCFWPQNQAV